MLIKQTLAQGQKSNPLSANVTQYGCRSSYPSFSTTLPPWPLPTLFDNTQKINSSEELQVSNGYFTTYTATNTKLAYLNYSPFLYDTTNYQTSINYTTISNTGYRFATFVWNVAQATYNNLSFNINGIRNINQYATLLYCSDNTTPIYMYYRTIDSSSPIPIDGLNNSSSWINANLTEGLLSVTTGTWQTNTVSGSGTNLSGLLGSGTGITISSSNVKLTVSLPTLAVKSSSVYIIFRIGIPMNKDVGFQSVQALIS